MSPVDGYPADEELKAIREWDKHDPRGWLEYCQGIWWAADWGWPEVEGEVSTGGWSGNEDIIDAMQDNAMLWLQTWESTRRGGHYTFRLPKKSPRAKVGSRDGA